MRDFYIIFEEKKVSGELFFGYVQLTNNANTIGENTSTNNSLENDQFLFYLVFI